MWQTIVEANSLEEFQSARPTIYEVPTGSEVVIRIELVAWAPIGKLADLAGAEWWGQKLAPELRVADVYGNWHWMEIRGIATGMAPVVLIPLIVFGLAALGWGAWIYSKIKISADVKEREEAKIEFIEERLREGYTPEQIDRWLEGIESPPPGIELPKWLAPAGIGIGTILLIGLAVLLIMRK